MENTFIFWFCTGICILLTMQTVTLLVVLRAIKSLEKLCMDIKEGAEVLILDDTSFEPPEPPVPARMRPQPVPPPISLYADGTTDGA